MPATPSRIGFIQQEWRRATAETALPKTIFGNLARESDDPIETFFDSVTDAQTVANARQDLLSGLRRRFAVSFAGVDTMLSVSQGSAIVLADYVDTRRDVSRKVAIAEVTIDLGRDSSAATIWG